MKPRGGCKTREDKQRKCRVKMKFSSKEDRGWCTSMNDSRQNGIRSCRKGSFSSNACKRLNNSSNFKEDTMMNCVASKLRPRQVRTSTRKRRVRRSRTRCPIPTTLSSRRKLLFLFLVRKRKRRNRYPKM